MRENLSNKIAMIGVGYTPQGKVPNRTAVSFHIEAIRNALNDAGISKDEVDALYVYRHFDPIGGDYETTAFTVAEQLGINPDLVSQEKYCTRSWLYNAVGLLNSGLAKYVVISYGDNARSAKRSFVKELKDNKATDELATYGDLSTMAKYAMLASKAMHEYGTGPDVWKEISLAQRAWAQLNPIASMYGKPLTDEDYYNADMVVYPFRLLDATPTTDGGRAIVLTTTENAKALKKDGVMFKGFGSTNKTLAPFRLDALDPDSAAIRASKMAYEMSGLSPSDIDALELYDCFTYTVEATLRDYGFFKPEEVKEFITKENLGPGGKLPVNTSGGMLSEAYFMGLTPLAEAYMQLLGRCGERQLKDPKYIMVSDNGAVFQSHLAMILERIN